MKGGRGLKLRGTSAQRPARGNWSGVLTLRYALAGVIIGLVLFLIASTIRRA